MSTRGIIARTSGPEGQFAGRYHHSDSYPTGLGAELRKQLHGHFRGDLGRMLRFLLDEHNAGWSTIVNKDFSLKPGYTWERAYEKSKEFAVFSQLPDYKRPQCYCCGSRHEEEQSFTQDDLESTDCEWLYVFDEDTRKLFVRDINHKEDVAVIDVDGDEPDWAKIECGENFERCHHCAWVHFPQLKGSNIGIQQFLGREAFRLCDAVAFIVNGKRVKNTGSGGDAAHLSRFHKIPAELPPNTWIATVVYANGSRADVPVAVRGPGGEKPFPNVKWVFPPTLVNPRETVVG